MSEEDESGFKLIDNNFVTSNDTLFSWLSRLLATCDTLNIASAFFSISNPGDHVFKLLHLISRDYTAIKVNLVVSNHLDVHVQKIFKSLVRHKFFKELDEKEKQAFDLLSTLNLEIHIVSEDTKGRSRFFHPKVYLCTKSGTPVSFILGSGNFTPAGLGKSVELLMLEREPSRCQKVNEWFEKLQNVAPRLSPESIENVQTISSEIEGISCGPDEPLSVPDEIDQDERIPITVINLDEESRFFYEFDISSDDKGISINGLDYTDLEIGVPDFINKNSIIAWALRKPLEAGFSIIKCRSDDDIKEFFSRFQLGNSDWVQRLEKAYLELPVIDKHFIGIKDGEINIEVLSFDGKLIQGKIRI